MSDSKWKGKKRPKSYYLKCANPKKRYASRLDIGMKGFLVTCNNREREAVRESYSILNEFADKLYGPEVINKTDHAKESSEESDEDMEGAMEKAIKEIKETKTVERRFRNVDTSAKNCLFIRTLLDNPEELTSEIFKDLWSTKVQKSRYICRLLPILGTCRANAKEICMLAEKLLDPYFRTPFGQVTTYEISFKVRNNASLDRSTIMDMINKLINEMNILNKVKLEKPDLVVLIEVVCNVCCLGVVRDFYKYKKGNLFEMSKPFEMTRDECSNVEKESTNVDQAGCAASDLKEECIIEETAGNEDDMGAKTEENSGDCKLKSEEISDTFQAK